MFPLRKVFEIGLRRYGTERSMNQVFLMGRLGGDPEMRGTVEHPVVQFSLATNESYKNKEGEIQEKTDWHRISVFRLNLRDTTLKYLKKGSRVHVAGKLTYSQLTDKDGTKRTFTSIIADDIIFLTNRSVEETKED